MKNAINSKSIDEVMLGMSIGSKIHHLRKVKNMTQEELAELVGTHQPSIARMEQYNYLPSLSFLIKVARVLGKRVEIRFKNL